MDESKSDLLGFEPRSRSEKWFLWIAKKPAAKRWHLAVFALSAVVIVILGFLKNDPAGKRSVFIGGVNLGLSLLWLERNAARSVVLRQGEIIRDLRAEGGEGQDRAEDG